MMGPGAWAGTTQPLPTPFPEVRYRQMSLKSPFAVASASGTATAAPTPGFAAQLYVDGVAHVGKTDFVAIKSREAPEPNKPSVIFLEVGGTTPDGMRIDGVKWSDEMGKSTVDVSKGGETATLVFDQAQMAVNRVAGQQSTSSQTPGPLNGAGVRQPGGPFMDPAARQQWPEELRRRRLRDAGQ